MKDFTEQEGVKKMPAYKNKETGTWYVMTQYTDWTGERKQKCKRGFSTRREALEWEQKFQQLSAGDLDMSFEAFVEIYTTDLKARLKESTWQTKEHIIQTKIVPYFGKRKINEITTKDVIAWQNELLAYRDEKHKPYSQSYLKTLHNQLSAIFNHAVRFYDLRSNPAAKAGNMGSEERKDIAQEKKESALQKALDAAHKLIAELKNTVADLTRKLAAVTKELSEYKSVRGKLRTADLEKENDRLRSRLRTYEDVISRNNLWSYFSRHRGKTPTKDEAR